MCITQAAPSYSCAACAHEGCPANTGGGTASLDEYIYMYLYIYIHA